MFGSLCEHMMSVTTIYFLIQEHMAEWSRAAVNIAVAQGLHPTAIEPKEVALVHEDMDYQVKAGFTEVIYWDEIKDILPGYFKILPGRL